MLRSAKEYKDMNKNLVYTQIGNYKVFQDLLSFTCWDENGNEYSIKSLLEKILELEQTNKQYSQEISRLNEKISNYSNVNNSTESLIARATDLISKKIAEQQMEIDMLKDKTKYL